MPLTLDEIISLAPATASLLRDIRAQLVESRDKLGPIVEEARKRILLVRDPDSEGGRRITRGEARQLLADLRDIGLRAIALISDDDEDIRKLARRAVKLAFAIMRDLED